MKKDRTIGTFLILLGVALSYLLSFLVYLPNAWYMLPTELIIFTLVVICIFCGIALIFYKEGS